MGYTCRASLENGEISGTEESVEETVLYSYLASKPSHFS